MTTSRLAGELRLRDQIERMAHRTASINSLVEQYTAPLDTPAWMLMRLLERHAPVRSSELAALGRLSRPSVSRCLAALEQTGLVSTEPDPHDRRAAQVTLTADGRRHLAHVGEVAHERIRDITADFTADEIAVLGRLLTRLNDNADATAVEPARYRLEKVTK